MLIEIIQIRLIKVCVIAAISYYSKRCKSCGYELDLEDYFFNNMCEVCGSSQDYNKEYFEGVKNV